MVGLTVAVLLALVSMPAPAQGGVYVVPHAEKDGGFLSATGIPRPLGLPAS